MENQQAEKKDSRKRSVAIIAHVDHGKTTLVNGLLKQTGTFGNHEEVPDCAMDSNDLEKERQITILAKPTLVEYEYEGEVYRINILDTPGHADFGGEVERILSMVDSVVLVVDAGEGPMPQTRFVLRKALERGLRPIVVINKIDRPNVDPNVALTEVFDLFDVLGANAEQLDFLERIAFASGAQGIAKLSLEGEGKDLSPLLDLIVKHCPPSPGNPDAPLQLQISMLDHSDFLGRIAIGRIHNGKIAVGMPVALLKEDGIVVKGKPTKLFTFKGLKRIEVTEASAGEIVAIAGFDDFNVSDTIVPPDSTDALPRIAVDNPTLKMGFLVNDSPYKGTEGNFVTSRQIKDRLFRELEKSVSLRVEETSDTNVFMVSGRGELHLGILIETMRREGYEFAVSRPEVILDGEDREPFERLLVDVPEEYMGAVIEELGRRKAEMKGIKGDGTQKLLEFEVPTRGLLGFHSKCKKLTKGYAEVHHAFLEFRPWCGDLAQLRNGVLVHCEVETGEATEYALEKLQDRGVFFIKPGTKVYEGMIIGRSPRPKDEHLNICKKKKLTNVRTTASEGIANLEPPEEMSLERCLEYIAANELVEVTPLSIRMRKKELTK